MTVPTTIRTKLGRRIATVSVTLIALTVTLAGLFTAEATTSRPSPVRVAAHASMQPTPQSDAGFLIQAKHSGECLMVAGNSIGEGVAVVQWPCNFDPAAQPAVQRWRQDFPTGNPNQFRLISQFSGKCLDLAFASKDRAAAVVQRTCNGSPSQLWTKIFQASDGSSELQNVGSTFVLRVSNGSTERSAVTIQWDSDPTLLYQRVTLVP